MGGHNGGGHIGSGSQHGRNIRYPDKSIRHGFFLLSETDEFSFQLAQIRGGPDSLGILPRIGNEDRRGIGRARLRSVGVEEAETAFEKKRGMGSVPYSGMESPGFRAGEDQGETGPMPG